MKQIYHSVKHAITIQKDENYFMLRHHGEHVIRVKRGNKDQFKIFKNILRGLIDNHKRLGLSYEN